MVVCLLQAELKKKIASEDLPKFFGFYANLLKKNSPNGVFVGKEVSISVSLAGNFI